MIAKGDTMQLTHLNAQGEANMVDVGDKAETR
ncbi:MAG: cyclic pyranopterin monophosphate synthase MoaC, partial [Halomonas sp.]|nr:cyclic pyranopterin monophosphate synthase MoaC [Halomonas sp.]